ncbi:30S ribosomal protein S12 methylthiotransferase RimO [Membranicola marinus]|uniref:Ribosomal protein uS12 methylthiotransferase RimO n=1 Tax=Membranihabitans marinus TaxID=1227546 RepID=A0A953HX93_9BACT|nr:30S ribosomal protein S12 methylthiotransferase RimO [Membranihabitans marinus]MBY5959841.1 30S ribosomal protein S12 methylthiotransferase RimO [Membranihabitans marinus]
MRTKGIHEQKVKVITLGCSKNLVDSENIMTQLQANEIEAVHEGTDDCDVAIINTCGFIDLAKEESVNTILDYVDRKQKGQVEKVYVTGCLSQRYKEDLKREIPDVDAWFGTMELPALLQKFETDYRHDLIGDRFLTTVDHYAYLKISEGCNRTCAFCAIPLMRGKHVSQPIERLVDQARHFARRGVRELVLIAQELTYYGLDIYKKRALPELLTALSEVEGIDWIRLHYAYPTKFPLEILDVMREQPKVCNYLDIPLQHAANAVLKRMRRQITREETEALLQTIRSAVPGIAVRTTMLVGFPGETESDFEELVDFVKEQEFDRLGVFAYSHEEDTAAHDFEDDVPEEVKTDRVNRLMEIQRNISLKKNHQRIGARMRVLVDRKEGEYFYGRSEFDSPEVDNEILIPAESFVRIGDFVDVKIYDALEYDLFGKPIS